MSSQKTLQDRTALVTGASSGIGAATAIALAARGADILIHYNSQEAEAAEVLHRVRVHGVKAELLQADLSTAEGTHKLAAAARQRPVDILVNNAGSLIRRTRVLDITEDLWESVMRLNLTSVFLLAQAALPGMVERKQGHIVNVSSLAALNGGGLGAGAYSAAKGAVSTLTKSLAREFAPLGVQVNAVSPGTVDTGYHRSFSTEQALDAVRAATPVGRIGASEEVADVIVYLCTPQSSFIHGQVLEVNGGFSMS